MMLWLLQIALHLLPLLLHKVLSNLPFPFFSSSLSLHFLVIAMMTLNFPTKFYDSRFLWCVQEQKKGLGKKQK